MLHSPAKVATHPRGVAAKRERVIAWESRRMNKVILQGIQVEPGVSEEFIVLSCRSETQANASYITALRKARIWATERCPQDVF
jgi:hypothetical protein